uniref:Uncharacterized protein n=1 Tax=Oryza sativa subsp. japonica TaxID=39947 RepID=Q7F8T7_ORYSJ|nr:hypothetical protein [Oryza sativa Japonica Group]
MREKKAPIGALLVARRIDRWGQNYEDDWRAGRRRSGHRSPQLSQSGKGGVGVGVVVPWWAEWPTTTLSPVGVSREGTDWLVRSLVITECY